MHDMIGASGMLRGWAVVWHTYLVWLLVLLAVSVAMTALIEWLIPTLRPRVSERQLLVDHAALDTHMPVGKPR